MNFDRTNNWLSLLANVGVVIGLGMLIFELKHASDLSEVDAYQTRVNEISETSKEFALSEDLAEIYERLRTEGVGTLTPVELRRVRAWETGKIIRMQAQFYQYQRGFLEEIAVQAMLLAAVANVDLWDELGVVADDPEFRRAVDALAAKENPSATPY
jgi:hypothetical protein